MSSRSTDINTDFIRCALTKIDLKGRFVFIDDRFEKLVGCTKEDLFGKSLSDFLSDSSRPLLDKLLTSRNHYETYFDTSCLTLLTSNKEEIDVRIVVSLNFIGGNPVNFQLIFLPIEVSSKTLQPVESDKKVESYLNSLVTLQQYNNPNDLIQALLHWSGADIVALYENRDGQLNQCQLKEKPFNPGMESVTLTELDEIHYDIYNEITEYCFVNKDDIQWALEKYQTAPNEYIGVIPHEQKKYLVRLIYAEEYDHNDLIYGLQQCSIALQLFRYNNSEQASGDQYPDIKFTIGFLDALAVPAFLTDYSGKIIGYNSASLNLFDPALLKGDYIHLLREIKTDINESSYEQVIEYITSALTEKSDDKFSFIYSSKNNTQYEVTILKLSDEATDLTSCFVFMPRITGNSTQPVEALSGTPGFNDFMPDLTMAFGKASNQLNELEIPSGADEQVVISDVLRELENTHSTSSATYRISCSYKSMPVLAGTADGWRLFFELVWQQALESNDSRIQFTFKGTSNKNGNGNGIACTFTHHKGYKFDSHQIVILSILSDKLGYHLEISSPEPKTKRYLLTQKR